MDPPDETHFKLPVVRWTAGSRSDAEDSIVAEEPLEIRVNDLPLAVTMRTPGDDLALAAGFLATEGILRGPDDLFDLTRCAEPDYPDLFNIVTAYVSPDRVPPDLTSGRQRYASSSCGLCGRATIDAVRGMSHGPVAGLTVSAAVLYDLPERMREAQRVFSHTGGLHAAALFRPSGDLVHLAEDVGRHNAVDKVIGRALAAGEWPPVDRILMVSGRAGFEIVQKACVVGIPVVCSVSAPSSLAVQLARETGVTLIGFLRGQTMNVYHGAEFLLP
jgi:FdhD protein